MKTVFQEGGSESNLHSGTPGRSSMMKAED